MSGSLVAHPERLETRRARRLFAVSMGIGLALCGCAGHASIHLIPTGPKPIRTSGPLITQINPKECYFWIDDNGDLCVTMRLLRRAFWDKRFDREFGLSFVLDDPPADSARYYHSGRRTLRARERFGLTHKRWGSITGVVLVSDYGTSRLQGRFRVTAKQQSYFALTGWGRDQWTLMLGEFVALRNQAAGEQILAFTEVDGLAREPRTPTPSPDGEAAGPAADSP